jgi:fructose-bisphosphate aldolase, class II
VLVNYSGVLKLDGGIGDKKAYDPRAWSKRAESAMAARVTAACELFGSAGRSLTA